MRQALLTILACAGIQVGYSQPWIGFDDLSQAINTNRWTSYNDTLLQTAGSGLTISSPSTNGVVDAGLNLNFSLPTNQSWQVTLRSSFDTAYTPLAGGLLETFVGVSSTPSWSGSSSSYYANAHQRNSIGLAIVPNWSINGAATQETSSPVTSRESLLRISFDGAGQLLTSYALPNDPTNFIQVGTQHIGGWSAATDFYLAIGFYAVDTSVAAGDLKIQSVDIVPEPSTFSLLLLGLGVILRRPSRRL